MKIENCKVQIAKLSTGEVLIGGAPPRSLAFAREPAASATHVGRRSPICIFHFSFFIFQFRIAFFALGTLLFALCAPLQAQTITDKMIATVTNGSRATPDLITYSDLVWQLALEPETPFAERPSSTQLGKALHTREDQLLVLQEARKLPGADSPDAIKEIDEAVKQRRDELAKSIGSPALEVRMVRVGLSSEQLDAILRDRVAIEKYLDFRFRAFVVIGQKEISDRYNQQYGPLRNSGRIVPTLDQVRGRLEHDLIEEKIAAEIDVFVDNLREQPGTEIVVLNPV